MNAPETDTDAAWRKIHPAMAAYVDALPSGWSSYPECEAAATLITALRRVGAFGDLAVLPPKLAALVARDLRDDEWVPEVEYVAVMLGVLDDSFAGDPRSFLDWASEVNARRMARAIDPAVLATSVDVLLANTEKLWNTFHRGTRLRVASASRDCAVTQLDYPPNLFPPILIDYFASAHATSLTRVDAALPDLETSTRLEGERAITTFTARWRVA